MPVEQPPYSWLGLMAKDKVKETLKDPKSAQFKNVMFRNVGNSPVICGEVNSKNSFGGYIGFQRFWTMITKK